MLLMLLQDRNVHQQQVELKTTTTTTTVEGLLQTHIYEI